MAQVTLIRPLKGMRGRLGKEESGGRIIVTRQKVYGKTRSGEVISGPIETYIYTKHEGKWSEGAEANRKKFADRMKRAHAEVKDAERKAYWMKLFEEQLEHPKGGKRYVKLEAFVAAQLPAEEEVE